MLHGMQRKVTKKQHRLKEKKMKLQKSIFLNTIFVLFLLSGNVHSQVNDKNFHLKISSPQNKIKYGAPVIINIEVTFKEPQISSFTGEVMRVRKLGGMRFHYKNKNTGQESTYGFAIPVSFHLKDDKGLVYFAKELLLWEVREPREKLIANLLFESPGNYTFTLTGPKKTVSNTIAVEIIPSEEGEKALSLLSDPNTIAFLWGGLLKSPDTVSALEELVKQYEKTVLAKWAAARLGIEYFIDFHKEHTSFEKFLVKYRQNKVQNKNFDNACKYLTIALNLPDDFPIRERILYELIRVEFIKGNYEKVSELLDELAIKYTKGKYGKKVPRIRAELEELKTLYPNN